MTAHRMGTALLVLLLTAAAGAETLFYREVPLDEGRRLLAFAQMARYEHWASSGEMGEVITRPGYGAAGETVVFDSEDAVNLYNFKHDKPGEVFKKPAAPKPAEASVVRLGTTIFTDFTYQDEPRIIDTDKNSVHRSEFEVRRAYVNLTGNISDLLSFRVTPDVAARQSTTSSGTGLPSDFKVSSSFDGSLTVRLKYAFGQLNLDKLGAGAKGSWIRLGQQQTPYLDFMEGIYRYRFQGTLFVERQGLLSSSDVGLSGHYSLPADYGDVHVGFYNGDTYTKAEANGQKAFEIRGSLRPFPKHAFAKGIRAHAFYDHDSPVKGGSRNRFVAGATFENRYLNFGVDSVHATDRLKGLPGTDTVRSNGWSIWVNPRTTFGLEGLFRYDRYRPNEKAGATKREVIAGVAYWLAVLKAPRAAALLADYDGIDYDPALGKPNEKRWELKALLSF
jgi:hypothetical protein